MMKGRRTKCALCGNDASPRRRRYRVVEYQRGQTVANRGGRSAGYLCGRCGDLIAGGDVLTAMQRNESIAGN